MIIRLFIPFILFWYQSVEPIVWSGPMLHDFGRVQSGWFMKKEFYFTNNTKDALTIDNVRTSCECTVADWEDDVIPPGRISQITVIFNPKNEGYYKKSVKVYFHKIKKPYKLTVEADVEE
jgi:Protein of unknown function (DUF1573)